MSKLLKIVLAGSLALGISATTASADVVKGQKLFTKLRVKIKSVDVVSKLIIATIKY